MSTGLDCRFYEKEPRKWFYDLEKWSRRDDYDTYGPFGTWREAYDHLGRNHANPGGFSISALPGCPHDLKEPDQFQPKGFYNCNRCGAHLDLRSADEKNRAKLDKAWKNDAIQFPRLLSGIKAAGGLTNKQKQFLIGYFGGIEESKLDELFDRAIKAWQEAQVCHYCQGKGSYLRSSKMVNGVMQEDRATCSQCEGSGKALVA